MNNIMKILIGSSVFFKEYSDFNPHDIDYVLFEDCPQLYKIFAHINTKTEDIFAYKQMSKDEFLEYESEHCQKAKMAVGKLLVPELVKYMNITIDDLKKFKFAIDEIQEKHSYEKIIYDAYIKNNDFILTYEQRDKAYQEYKKYR